MERPVGSGFAYFVQLLAMRHGWLCLVLGEDGFEWEVPSGRFNWGRRAAATRVMARGIEGLFLMGLRSVPWAERDFTRWKVYVKSGCDMGPVKIWLFCNFWWPKVEDDVLFTRSLEARCHMSGFLIMVQQSWKRSAGGVGL
ncbi:hypothetical protein U1Q18_041902 [Sarracenia purpurea var. burkii]